MQLTDLQPEAMAALDVAEARAREVVDPVLIALIEQRLAWLVAGGPAPEEPRDERAVDVAAVIDQMLIDVSRLDDDTVRRADRHFPPGGLSDVVTASYVLEARTRLRLAWPALTGGAR